MRTVVDQLPQYRELAPRAPCAKLQCPRCYGPCAFRDVAAQMQAARECERENVADA
jgi:hypothetical protein